MSRQHKLENLFICHFSVVLAFLELAVILNIAAVFPSTLLGDVFVLFNL